MHKQIVAVFVLAAACLLSPCLNAATMGSTEYLLRSCETKSEFCPVYIRGFMEGLTTAWFWDEKGICLPESITTKQAMAVFVKWANEHPEKWNQRDGISLGEAMIESFPCIASSP